MAQDSITLSHLEGRQAGGSSHLPERPHPLLKRWSQLRRLEGTLRDSIALHTGGLTVKSINQSTYSCPLIKKGFQTDLMVFLIRSGCQQQR